MIKRPQGTITIPRKSPISRDEVEATLKKQWRHVDFTFCEGDVDSHCRVTETSGFEGPALFESIRSELKRIERRNR